MTFSNAAPPPDDSYPRWVRTALARLAGEPDALVLFDSTIREPTELLADVIRGAFDGGVTDRYESVFASGNRYLAEAVAGRYGVTPAQVIGTSGATSALAMAIRAFVGPGDRVLVERPCFDVLPDQVREAGASVDWIARRPPHFGIDPDELAAAIRPDTRLILLTHLHNPSGAALDRAALTALADVARTAGVPILLDAVYADFLGPEACAIGVAPEFIVAGSLSKVQGLFALRCGWLAASPENVARIEAANPQGDLAVSKLTHAIGALVLEEMAPFDAHWRDILAAARPVLERRAAAMIEAGLLEGAPPPFGCMYFPRVVGVTDTLALSEDLWASRRLVVAPGEFFGAPGHIRIGFGNGADALDRGLAELHVALAERRAASA